MPHKDPEARRAYLKANAERIKVLNAARCRKWYEANKQLAVDRTKEWRLKNPKNRTRQMRSAKYGLTQADVDRMTAEQGGVCAICKMLPDGKGPMSILHVDHDHETGQVRAMLCPRCNKGLGSFRDNPGLLQKAAWYLIRHKPVAEIA